MFNCGMPPVEHYLPISSAAARDQHPTDMLSFNGSGQKGEEYMREQVILDTLQGYVNDRILQDTTITLEPDASLLEWGVLNSITAVQLIEFIRKRFQVDVPPEEVAGRNFRDLRSIARLLAQLSAQ